jgi:hypothetical protein
LAEARGSDTHSKPTPTAHRVSPPPFPPPRLLPPPPLRPHRLAGSRTLSARPAARNASGQGNLLSRPPPPRRRSEPAVSLVLPPPPPLATRERTRIIILDLSHVADPLGGSVRPSPSASFVAERTSNRGGLDRSHVRTDHLPLGGFCLADYGFMGGLARFSR